MMWLFFLFIAVVASESTEDDDSVMFSCDFEETACGFINEDDLQSQWVRKQVTLAGKTSYVMMVENIGNGSIARMLSPFFEITGEKKKCLKFDHYQSGKGAGATYVEYLTEMKFYTWAALFKDEDRWHHYEVNAVIEDYFWVIFEGHNFPEVGPGTIAIDNIEYRLGPCD